MKDAVFLVVVCNMGEKEAGMYRLYLKPIHRRTLFIKILEAEACI